MKWIRTECGMIFNKWNKTIRNQVLVLDKWYVIEKQGDNLIDVLEDKDIVVFGENGGNQYFAYALSDIEYEMSCYGLTKVITHEQYMPLAQSVNNES